VKQGDLAAAVKFFNKSLTEHRTPDILAKLRETERGLADAERQAYINPELSEQAREEGNKLFKEGDFAGAVKQYTEAIKRNPTDPRGYNNRALAYTKLLALSEALKDANEAIKIDPNFGAHFLLRITRPAHALTPPTHSQGVPTQVCGPACHARVHQGA
jgi:stress-induced-phosphoprotein 1